MAMDAAAASPLFLRLGEPEEDDDDDEGEESELAGQGRLSPTAVAEAVAAAAAAAAISEPMRSGKLSSAREPRMRYAARSYAAAASSALS